MKSAKPGKSPFSLSPNRISDGTSLHTLKINPFKYENTPEVTELTQKLRNSGHTLMEERAKTKDLADIIERKRQEITKLSELHSVNQDVVVKNEKELNVQRGKATNLDLMRQKEASAGVLKTLNERFQQVTGQHFSALRDLPRESLPEHHSNKVIHLMLAQIRLYQTQNDQRQEDQEDLINRYERKYGELAGETETLRTEIQGAGSSRLTDMKAVLKLGRTEAYTAEEIRGHGGKPTDELATEATGEVITKLRKKLGDTDGNEEFLRSLEDKLKRRGLNLELS